MKSFKELTVLLGIILTSLWSSADALVLNDDFDMNTLKGTKIGYYVGSFDPIHLGHQNVIEQALKSEHVDYVLINPVPGGDNYKNRSSLAIRLEMIASVYAGHPKVLLTYWTPKELQDKFSQHLEELAVVGIIGSDVVTDSLLGPDKMISEKYRSVFMRGIPLNEKHFTDTIGVLMALKANSFLVALRGDIDLGYLEDKICDRSILGFIFSNDISSTEIKRAIQSREPFEHLLSIPVGEIIKQKQLYGFEGTQK